MSRVVNESKRARMGQVVQQLLAKGWTRTKLAAEMKVSSSTVSTWSRGKSMGTNHQRQYLEALVRQPAKTPAQPKKTVKKAAAKPVAASKAVSPVVAKKVAAMVKAVYRALPARVRCPHCKKNRTKDAFGLRIMKRDPKGLPTVIRRQSWCQECRG